MTGLPAMPPPPAPKNSDKPLTSQCAQKLSSWLSSRRPRAISRGGSLKGLTLRSAALSLALLAGIAPSSSVISSTTSTSDVPAMGAVQGIHKDQASMAAAPRIFSAADMSYSGFQPSERVVLKHAAAVGYTPEVTAAELRRQADCLAFAAYGEARGEPKAGKRGVMWTAVWRAIDEGQPHRLCTQVLAENQYQATELKQFRPQAARLRNQHLGDDPKLHDADTFADLRRLAWGILAGEVDDNTGGARYFMTVDLYKQLRRKLAAHKLPKNHFLTKVVPTGIIGGHVFLKPLPSSTDRDQMMIAAKTAPMPSKVQMAVLKGSHADDSTVVNPMKPRRGVELMPGVELAGLAGLHPEARPVQAAVPDAQIALAAIPVPDKPLRALWSSFTTASLIFHAHKTAPVAQVQVAKAEPAKPAAPVEVEPVVTIADIRAARRPALVEDVVQVAAVPPLPVPEPRPQMVVAKVQVLPVQPTTVNDGAVIAQAVADTAEEHNKLLHLASYKGQKWAHLGLQQMARRPELQGANLKTVDVDLPGKGHFVRVVASVPADRAKNVCSSLQSSGTYCRVLS